MATHRSVGAEALVASFFSCYNLGMNEPEAKSVDQSNAPFEPPVGWTHKFRYAFRGLVLGVASQSSFRVHLPMAVLVIGLACWLRVSVVELCMLLLCIALVISLELLNSGLEFLAAEVTQSFSKRVESALDVAAAAVLVASCFAAVIGLLILVPKIYALWLAGAA